MTFLSRLTFSIPILLPLVMGAAGNVTTAMAAEGPGGLGVADKGDEAGIRSTMAAYNAALNAGKTADVLPLYTEDGVFMAPYSDSSIGIDAVRAAYDRVFRELAFNVKFTINELVQLSPDYAYVRTHSSGTTHHASTGKTTSEANQELFILRKGADGRWRIARYSFSPIDPPIGG